jgi:predicted AAA+ superfamily ATPase
MLESVSGNPNREKGRKLENLIFLHLRKKYSEIYYFDRKDKGECDFITTNRSNIKEIIQVCYELTPDNLNRELNGLAEAMHFFNFNKAVIVTFDQKDKITYKDFDISVVPAHEFLTGL